MKRSILRNLITTLLICVIVSGNLFAQKVVESLEDSTKIEFRLKDIEFKYEFKFKNFEAVNFTDEKNSLSFTVEPVSAEIFDNFYERNITKGLFQKNLIDYSSIGIDEGELRVPSSIVMNKLFEYGFDYSIINYVDYTLKKFEKGLGITTYRIKKGRRSFQTIEEKSIGRGLRLDFDLTKENLDYTYLKYENKLVNPLFINDRYASLFRIDISNESTKPTRICPDNFSILSNGIIYTPYLGISTDDIELKQYYNSVMLYSCKMIPPNSTLNTFLSFQPLFSQDKFQFNYMNGESWHDFTIALEKENNLVVNEFSFISELKVNSDKTRESQFKQIINGVVQANRDQVPIFNEFNNFLIYKNDITFIEGDILINDGLFEESKVLSVGQNKDYLVIYLSNLSEHNFNKGVLEVNLNDSHLIFYKEGE